MRRFRSSNPTTRGQSAAREATHPPGPSGPVSGLPRDVYFEDAVIGFEFRSPSRTVSHADILQFAELTGDRTALHTDPDVARRGPFGRPIAHGVFGVSLMVGLKSQLKLYEKTSIAALGWDKVRYHRPIFAGDTLRVSVKYLAKRISETDPGRGILTECVTLLNQDDETVTTGEHAIMLRLRDVAR